MNPEFKRARRNQPLNIQILLSCFGLICLFSCARLPLKDPKNLMRQIEARNAIVDGLEDSGDIESLKLGLDEQIKFWELKAQDLDEKKKSDYFSQNLKFGQASVSVLVYMNSLKQLRAFIQRNFAEEKSVNKDKVERLREYLLAHFDFYEVYGDQEWGSVFVTGYYEPVLKGYRRSKGSFTQPLYRTPKNLVNLRFDLFAELVPSLSDWTERLKSDPYWAPSLRGQLRDSPDALNLPEVVPFPDRRAIDGNGVLKGQSLEICYVDPLDAFFLQIQGSGRVDLDDGTSLYLTYAAQNGHPYHAIGKELLNVIPKEELSMATIVRHLRSLPIEERDDVLFTNASYIFFRRSPQTRGISFQGTPVVGGRTIATDKNLFPKGTLALLEFEKPVFTSPEDIQPQMWRLENRIVFDQDTGGAIRGPGRVDFFWGSGVEAAQSAGIQKGRGRLTYLVPKLGQMASN